MATAEVIERLDRAVQEEARRRRQFQEEEAQRQKVYEQHVKMNELRRTAFSRSPLGDEEYVQFSSAQKNCCCRSECQGLLADRATRLAVVVCHPWGPLGGSMHDFNVVNLVSLFAEAGITTLRFNFRYGIGRGHGAAADLRAACAMLSSLDAPPEKLLLLGYSCIPSESLKPTRLMSSTCACPLLPASQVSQYHGIPVPSGGRRLARGGRRRPNHRRGRRLRYDRPTSGRGQRPVRLPGRDLARRPVLETKAGHRGCKRLVLLGKTLRGVSH